MGRVQHGGFLFWARGLDSGPSAGGGLEEVDGFDSHCFKVTLVPV